MGFVCNKIFSFNVKLGQWALYVIAIVKWYGIANRIDNYDHDSSSITAFTTMMLSIDQIIFGLLCT
jgi:hypothetical protein